MVHFSGVTKWPTQACTIPVGLEQDSTHVVLVEQGWIHVIPLLYHEIASPEDITQQVVYPNQLSLCRALRVDLLLPGVTQGHSLAEAHPHPCMPPTVVVYSVRCASHRRESITKSADRMRGMCRVPIR